MPLFSRLPVLSLIPRCNLHTSSVVLGLKWRAMQGLPLDKTSTGPLTDKPDYEFVDGRPTPLGCHQVRRAKKQRELVTKIIKLINEVDFARQRCIDLKQAEEDKRAAIVAGRLKPKGHLIYAKNKSNQN